MSSNIEEKILTGIPASPGIAIGTALVLSPKTVNIQLRTILKDQVEDEINVFEQALKKAKEQVSQIQLLIQASLNDSEAKIFESHLLMLEDYTLINGVKDEIRKNLVSADYAFNNKIQYYLETIKKINDPYLSERSIDIKDIATRVLANIYGQENETVSRLPGQRIIISTDLTPSDTVSLDRENLLAFVTETGNRTSHSAIIARSMNIPAVVAVKPTISQIHSGDIVIVDGYDGSVIINPSPDTLNTYAAKETRGGKIREILVSEAKLKAETLDGFKVRLYANIECENEIEDIKRYGASGIGLYRTEFLYLNRTSLPDEELQFINYKSIAEQMNDSPVTIRTLDLGGDKLSGIINYRSEKNPFLGNRSIRLSLSFPEILKTQLRAIFRASAFGNIKVMFPMVCCIDEINQTLEIIETIKRDLRERDIPFDENIDIGIMIETPSAAIIAEKFAGKVSFFSIGTNDLVQYTLAVDRNSEQLAHLYQPSHPAILILMKNVTLAAKNAKIKLCVCGEMAGDPLFTPLLVGMGIDELSMSSISLGIIRRVIRKIRKKDAEALLNEVLDKPTAADVLAAMTDFLKKTDPELYSLAIKGE